LRVSYANVAFTRGTHAAGVALLATLAAIALLGGAGTALRLLARLGRLPAGPPWLALPAPASELVRLQAWEAELPLRTLAVLALVACVAAMRVAATLEWLAGVLLFPLAWAASCSVGRALAGALAMRAPSGPGATPTDVAGAGALATLAAAWAVRSPVRGGERRRDGSWRRRPRVVVLAVKDAWLARRARAPRASLVLAAALGVLSVAAWSLPRPVLRATAFALALLAAAATGEWLITLGGCDPFPTLRSLPVGPGSIWWARMLPAALATLVLVGAHAVAANGPPGLMRVSLAWLTFATLAILALAVDLQLTLFPQREPALRLFALALALALVSSLMIPLLGWVVLLAAVLHSARRLPRWWRLEEMA
jgi:hypothetical protein